MSKQSDKVKKWRVRTKEKLVLALGGKCQICGYDKCIRALALHHRNPDEKEFKFGALRASPRNIEVVIEEAKKCVLLCHNCHMEVHEDMIQVPDVVVFNEQVMRF